MKITPRFLPSHAIKVKEEFIAEAGNYILFNEEDILVLTEAEFCKLYEVERVFPNKNTLPKRKISKQKPGQDKFNKTNGPGFILTLFGSDGAGQYLVDLTIVKLTELTGLAKQTLPEKTVGSYLARLKNENLVLISGNKPSVNSNSTRQVLTYSLTTEGKALLSRWFPNRPFNLND